LVALAVASPLLASAVPASADTTSTGTTSDTYVNPHTQSWSVIPSASPGQSAVSPHVASTLVGSGSSFAGPEVLQWTTDTAKPPYNLNVNYTSTSSGDGRFNFGNGTVDFAVSDIPYQGIAFDTKQPSFPFMYVPVTAGGLAFMYHINGLSGTLQLSSYSACAVFTGATPFWDDPIIKADNPGVSLPHVSVHPVTRSDLAGTNFVFQEYCIHEQPALWAAFVNSPAIKTLGGQVGDLSATDPRSDWPLFPSAIPVSGSATAADNVAAPNNNGYITAVETAYALQRHVPVASVKNHNGVYTQPSALNVGSALAYATQNSDGTHNLNFDGAGPHVYNPSTYSYLLTPTTGWSASKGNTLSQFANYSLTLGQQKAPEIGYASLGLSLEQFGVNSIKQKVPGAVGLTAAEQGAYQCGDLTPSEVAAGATAPTCGVLNANDSTVPGHAGGTAATAASGSGSGASGGTTADAGVSLTGSPNLATTGASPWPLVVLGSLLVAVGWIGRRRLTARTR
jgi:phosphate transport system substrate-binding protein